MKVFAAATALVLCTFSHLAQADTIYINGTRHTLDKADFQQSGNKYVAYLDVVGDGGQNIIFDLDAIVTGKGKLKRPHWQCIFQLDASSSQAVIDEPILRPVCNGGGEPRYYPYYNFGYDVQFTVTCSGHIIGRDRDNRNSFTEREVTNLNRDVTLTIDSTKALNGSCQSLMIEVDGISLDTIDSIEVDATVSEAF